jgi:hypothetical protein
MAALLAQADGTDVLLVWGGLVLLGLAAMRVLLDWGPLVRERRGRSSRWITRLMAAAGVVLLVWGLAGWLAGAW